MKLQEMKERLHSPVVNAPNGERKRVNWHVEDIRSLIDYIESAEAWMDPSSLSSHSYRERRLTEARRKLGLRE